ncbi:MAG TPA: hypothetical protein VMR98_00210 [Candidatus Polarisedimenticolaceae bacterium]|nr:hypothetical protein [Candidatus Polarisedimenticolaceae bacterium]
MILVTAALAVIFMVAISLGIADRAPVPQFAKTSTAIAGDKLDKAVRELEEILAGGVARQRAMEECLNVAEGKFIIGRGPVFLYYQEYFCDQPRVDAKCFRYQGKKKRYFYKCTVEYVLQVSPGYVVKKGREFVTFTNQYTLNEDFERVGKTKPPSREYGIRA